MQVAILVTAARHEPSRTWQERFLLKTVFTNHLSSSNPGVRPRLRQARRQVPQPWQDGACRRGKGRDFYAAPHVRHTAGNWKGLSPVGESDRTIDAPPRRFREQSSLLRLRVEVSVRGLVQRAVCGKHAGESRGPQ
jgi:hypothetical protein